MGLLFIIFISCVTMSIAEALTIDNQLTVIRSDCYDRLAIGHRLNPKDIYKTVRNATTVRDCQVACTNEKDVCKALSFGIGVKSNATCELGLAQIKETVDLKPVGTIMEDDFDLYIKKLGCTLAIEKKPHIKPLGLFQDTLSPTQYSSEENPTNGKPNYLPKPPNRPPSDKDTQDTANSYQRLPQYEKPHEIPKRPVSAYENAQLVDKPSYLPEKPENSYDRPQNYQMDKPHSDYYRPHEFHKPHERPHIYNKNEYEFANQDRPDFIPDRPKPLNGYGHGEDEITRPNAIPNRPRPSPEYQHPEDEYHRPQAIPSRPVSEDGYGSHESEYNRPNDIPNRPGPEYGNQEGVYNRPHTIPDRPISEDDYGNHGFEYDRPGFNPNRPSLQEEYSGQHDDYERPHSIPDKPVPSNGYGSSEDVYERPGYIPNRPQPQDDYGNSGEAYDRPNRIPSRPQPQDGYGISGDAYNRPNSRPQTGWTSLNDYESHAPHKPGYEYGNSAPSRPQSSYDYPQKPQNHYNRLTNQYGKPERFPEKPGNGFDQPAKPEGETHQVQHLVSIATGPYPLSLHPVHNILVGTDSYRYGYPHTKPSYDREYHDHKHTKPTGQKPGYEKEDYLPPFRPLHLNHPYKDFDNEYDNVDRHTPRPYHASDDDRNSNWPRPPHHRPDYNEDDTDNYHAIDWRERDRLQGRPYYGPYPERYASYIPHPDEYDRRRPFEDEFYGPDVDRYDGPRRPFHRQPLYGQHYRRLYPEKPRPVSQSHTKENLKYNHTSASTTNTIPDEKASNETTASADNSTSTSTNENQPETQDSNNSRHEDNHSNSSNKSIVTQTVGPHGETITSIITEIDQIESSSRHTSW